MNSFFLSIKLVFSLLSYKKDNKYKIKIFDRYYLDRHKNKVVYKTFTPSKPRKLNFIIFPGASPTAESHPGLIMLGTVLSKIGYKVYIPRIPLLKKLIINDEVIKDFSFFYNWIINEKHIRASNIGLIGISFGGVMTLKIFENKSFIYHQPKSIFTYGTYNNFKSALDFLSSGMIKFDGKELKISPHPWGLVVMFYNYFGSINTNLNVKKINKVLEYQIQDDTEQVEINLDKLPDEEKKVTNKILNCTIDEEILSYISLMFEVNKKLLNNLSSNKNKYKVNSKVFIFHGANDNMIPYTESLDLSKNIKDVEVFISYLYEHKEIRDNKNPLVKFLEIIKMIKFVYLYISYNEN